jgi:sugar/nucleoside kinase (ribokinase family)
VGEDLKRLGVMGSMVWDTIHGREPTQEAVEEWGGIAYALAALDATLEADWAIVPLIKVGKDLAPEANDFLRGLRHVAPASRFVEVREPNNRVILRYLDAQRRCEQLRGGVPGWSWPELGAMVRDLDALHINFISGFEMSLETARMLRHAFPRFIYADLHSLLFAIEPDGTRTPQALPQAASWFGCFDVVQVNEEEMAQLGPDPLAVAAAALAQGCRALCVTLAERGVAYFEALPEGAGHGPIRSGRLPVDPADHAPPAGADPTGCGDVFGAAACAALLAGATLEGALRQATRLAARNVTHRGATGLRDHLVGRLSRA